MDAEFKKVSQSDIKKLGLQDRGQAIVHCADCSSELMVFQITKNNDDLKRDGLDPVTTRIKVCCSICDGESYIRTLEGQFYPGAPGDDMAFEPIECDDSNNYDIRFRAWKRIK